MPTVAGVPALSNDMYSMELKRMAVELQSFPFQPRVLRHAARGRKGVRTNGGFLARSCHGTYGCFVYHDIIALGGEGTRQQILRLVESMIEVVWTSAERHRWPDFTVLPDSTPPAVERVACLRAHASPLVAAPELELAVALYYMPAPMPPHTHAVNAAAFGAYVAKRIKALCMPTHGWRQRLLAEEAELITMAQRAWHFARLSIEDDTPEWLAEQAKMTELARVLGGGMSKKRTGLQVTRKITLDEFE